MNSNHYEQCLDLSLTLEERMQCVSKLKMEELDNLIERLCSMYNIHPTFICLQYLQALILSPKPCLKRRIRIAETCDLGRTVLFLLTRISNVTERISCIEMFTNVYLKHHAYLALYASPVIDHVCRIQIMKNLHQLPFLRFLRGVCQQFYQWFVEQLLDPKLDYKLKANCADFLLLNAPKSSDYYQEALKCLNLDKRVRNIYTHRENVHLFAPRPSVMESILKTKSRVDVDEILYFVEDHKCDVELFTRRILNDKTQLGTLSITCTLEELVCCVWSSLTEDLKVLLLEDIESSNDDEEGWMCTTGYYNRIINVYQSIQKDTLLVEVELLEEEEFIRYVTKCINQHLFADSGKDDILLEMYHSSESLRIKYLTFKVSTLPGLIDHLKEKYSYLGADKFDEYFAKAIRQYDS